jgi:hypothetical protein
MLNETYEEDGAIVFTFIQCGERPERAQSLALGYDSL